MKYGEYTDGIYLNKPAPEDQVSIKDLNENTEKLDDIISSLMITCNTKANIQSPTLYGTLEKPVMITNPYSRKLTDTGIAATVPYVEKQMNVRTIKYYTDINELFTDNRNYDTIYSININNNILELIWNGSEYTNREGTLVISPDENASYYECVYKEQYNKDHEFELLDEIEIKINQHFISSDKSDYEIPYAGEIDIHIEGESVEYTSKSNSIIKFTAISSGTSNITFTIKNGIEEKSCSLPITVKKINSIYWSHDSLNVYYNDTNKVQLFAQYSINNAKDITKIFNIISNNSDIIEVNGNTLIGKQCGDTSIIAELKDKYKIDNCIVNELNVSCVASLESVEWYVNETCMHPNPIIYVKDETPINLIAIYNDATTQDVTNYYDFTSSDNSLLTIGLNNENELYITGHRSGISPMITATLKDEYNNLNRFNLFNTLKLTVDVTSSEYHITPVDSSESYVNRLIKNDVDNYSIVIGYDAKFHIMDKANNHMTLISPIEEVYTNSYGDQIGKITVENETNNSGNGAIVVSSEGEIPESIFTINGEAFGLSSDAINLQINFEKPISKIEVQWHDHAGKFYYKYRYDYINNIVYGIRGGKINILCTVSDDTLQITNDNFEEICRIYGLVIELVTNDTVSDFEIVGDNLFKLQLNEHPNVSTIRVTTQNANPKDIGVFITGYLDNPIIKDIYFDVPDKMKISSTNDIRYYFNLLVKHDLTGYEYNYLSEEENITSFCEFSSTNTTVAEIKDNNEINVKDYGDFEISALVPEELLPKDKTSPVKSYPIQVRESYYNVEVIDYIVDNVSTKALVYDTNNVYEMASGTVAYIKILNHETPSTFTENYKYPEIINDSTPFSLTVSSENKDILILKAGNYTKDNNDEIVIYDITGSMLGFSGEDASKTIFKLRVIPPIISIEAGHYHNNAYHSLNDTNYECVVENRDTDKNIYSHYTKIDGTFIINCKDAENNSIIITRDNKNDIISKYGLNLYMNYIDDINNKIYDKINSGINHNEFGIININEPNIYVNIKNINYENNIYTIPTIDYSYKLFVEGCIPKFTIKPTGIIDENINNISGLVYNEIDDVYEIASGLADYISIFKNGVPQYFNHDWNTAVNWNATDDRFNINRAVEDTYAFSILAGSYPDSPNISDTIEITGGMLGWIRYNDFVIFKLRILKPISTIMVNHYHDGKTNYHDLNISEQYDCIKTYNNKKYIIINDEIYIECYTDKQDDPFIINSSNLEEFKKKYNLSISCNNEDINKPADLVYTENGMLINAPDKSYVSLNINRPAPNNNIYYNKEANINLVYDLYISNPVFTVSTNNEYNENDFMYYNENEKVWEIVSGRTNYITIAINDVEQEFEVDYTHIVHENNAFKLYTYVDTDKKILKLEAGVAIPNNNNIPEIFEVKGSMLGLTNYSNATIFKLRILPAIKSVDIGHICTDNTFKSISSLTHNCTNDISEGIILLNGRFMVNCIDEFDRNVIITEENMNYSKHMYQLQLDVKISDSGESVFDKVTKTNADNAFILGVDTNTNDNITYNLDIRVNDYENTLCKYNSISCSGIAKVKIETETFKINTINTYRVQYVHPSTPSQKRSAEYDRLDYDSTNNVYEIVCGMTEPIILQRNKVNMIFSNNHEYIYKVDTKGNHVDNDENEVETFNLLKISHNPNDDSSFILEPGNPVINETTIGTINITGKMLGLNDYTNTVIFKLRILPPITGVGIHYGEGYGDATRTVNGVKYLSIGNYRYLGLSFQLNFTDLESYEYRFRRELNYPSWCVFYGLSISAIYNNTNKDISSLIYHDSTTYKVHRCEQFITFWDDETAYNTQLYTIKVRVPSNSIYTSNVQHYMPNGCNYNNENNSKFIVARY